MADQGTVKSRVQGGVGFNTQVDLRTAPDAALVTTDGHGRYMEPLYVGNCFTAAAASGALTLTTATTYTGLSITNPVASGRNIVMLEYIFAATSAPAGVAGLVYNWQTSASAVTHTTPATVRNALLPGSGTTSVVPLIGIGLVDTAATWPAAGVAIRAYPGGPVATGSVSSGSFADAIDGKVILSPGSYFGLTAVTTAISGVISCIWEEVGLAQ